MHCLPHAPLTAVGQMIYLACCCCRCGWLSCCLATSLCIQTAGQLPHRLLQMVRQMVRLLLALGLVTFLDLQATTQAAAILPVAQAML